MADPPEMFPPIDSGAEEQKSPWEWISRAIGLWVALLAINGISGLLGHVTDLSSPAYDLVAQILSAVLILAVYADSGIQLIPLLRKWSEKGIMTVVGVAAALLGMYLFMWVYMKLATSIGIRQIYFLTDFNNHHWPIWSAFIIISAFPGIFEEIAFRGFIMTSLEKVGGPKEALIIQAAMFSVLHMLPAIFISHFVIGLILGVIRQKSRSLYPGMLFHTAWNAIVLLEEIWI